MYYSFSAELQANASGSIILNKDESHHLTKVFRAKKRNTITLLNGKGSIFTGTITDPQPRQCIVEILEHQSLRPVEPAIDLAICIPKGKTLDTIIKTATEIGARTIIPILSEHSEVQISKDNWPHKAKRLKQITIEACKQSKNPYLPVIKDPVSFLDYITELSLDNSNIGVIASLQNTAQPIYQLNIPTLGSITCLIGPEGDLSNQEYKQCHDKGFLPVKLANNILRTETAALYSLSALDAIRQK